MSTYWSKELKLMMSVMGIPEPSKYYKSVKFDITFRNIDTKEDMFSAKAYFINNQLICEIDNFISLYKSECNGDKVVVKSDDFVDLYNVIIPAKSYENDFSRIEVPRMHVSCNFEISFNQSELNKTKINITPLYTVDGECMHIY